MKNYIAPSLLSADKNDLKNEILKVEKLGAEYIHWDVMDGIFVPNKSYTPEQVQEFAKCHKMVNDVHIMVQDPKKWAPIFADAGADLVTFHLEAVDFCPKCTMKVINDLHDKGCKAGISIKPGTNVKTCFPWLDKVELVLVMSVEPGKGGQAFIPSALKKIKKLRKYIDKNNLNCLIEVDGGINAETGAKCRKAGADILVAGSYIYGHEDFKERMESLR